MFIGLGLGITRLGGGGAPAVPVAPVLTWDTASSDNTPQFTVTLTEPAVDDVVTFQIDTVNTFASASSTPDTVDAGEVTASQVTFTLTTLADGTYYVRAKVTRAGVDSAWSSTVDVTIATTQPSATFVADASAGGGATATATGVNIGAAAANRVLVIAVSNFSETTMTGLSLVPKTGATTHSTVTATSLNAHSGAGFPGTSWFIAAVPDGTTADISATYSSNPFNTARLSVFRVVDLASLTAVDAKQATGTSATTASVNLTTQSGGLALGVAVNRTTAGQSGGTITGTETYADDIAVSNNAGIWLEAGHASGVASNAASVVSATFGAAGNLRLSAVSLR